MKIFSCFKLEKYDKRYK